MGSKPKASCVSSKIGFLSGAIVTLATLVLGPATGFAQSIQIIEGKADVADARTLIIAGQPLRLTGILVPPADQTCIRDNAAYACGFEAINALAFMTSGQWLQCQTGARLADGARLARCLLGGRYDLGERMIRDGWAIPAPSGRTDPSYRDALADARFYKSGMWAGQFPLLQP